MKNFFLEGVARSPYVSWAFSFQLPSRSKKSRETHEHTFFFENKAVNGKEAFKVNSVSDASVSLFGPKLLGGEETTHREDGGPHGSHQSLQRESSSVHEEQRRGV